MSLRPKITKIRRREWSQISGTNNSTLSPISFLKNKTLLSTFHLTFMELKLTNPKIKILTTKSLYVGNRMMFFDFPQWSIISSTCLLAIPLSQETILIEDFLFALNRCLFWFYWSSSSVRIKKIICCSFYFLVVML